MFIGHVTLTLSARIRVLVEDDEAQYSELNGWKKWEEVNSSIFIASLESKFDSSVTWIMMMMKTQIMLIISSVPFDPFEVLPRAHAQRVGEGEKSRKHGENPMNMLLDIAGEVL